MFSLLIFRSDMLPHCVFFRFLLHFPPILALVYRFPIRSTGSIRTRLLHTGQWRAVMDQTHNDLSVDSDRHLEFYRGFYTSHIQMGTPPQSLLMAFDTGCPFFWVINSRCRAESCLGTEISGHNKTQFNASASTTLHGTGRPFVMPCVEGQHGEPTKGHVYKERVQIGPLHYDDQTFMLADQVADSWANHPVDGVFGLGWPTRIVSGHRPPLLNMIDQLDEPVFTFWVDWRRPDSLGGSGGFMTLGGPDNDNCEGPWRNISLKSRSSWQFAIQRFQVGRYRTFRTQYAIADTGTAMIGGPYQQINMIVDAVGAEFSQDDDLFTVQCEQIPRLPPFVLTIDGNDFAIPAEEYVLDLDLSDGKCALAVFGMYSNGLTADWVLGDIFFDVFCTMFDYKRGQLSFARAKDAVKYSVPYNRTSENTWTKIQ